MATDLIPLLFTGVDDATTRLRERLAGLTTREYLWEPVTDVWTVRPGGDRWLVDAHEKAPEPAPVPTIAWRLWHIASDCLATYASRSLGSWPLQVQGREWYGQVAPALEALDLAVATFRDRVTALGEDGVRQPLGPAWGPYADDSWAALVVHAQDELAHHGAEVALLRDLYLRLG
jgi:hypothetical protein